MHDMENLKYMLMDEVEEFERKGKLTSGDLPTIHMLTDTIKNICKIKMYAEADEYSSEGSYGSSYRGSSYEGGNSGARRRDRMGRYSREGSYAREGGGGGYSQGNSYRGYSRDGAKDYMMEQIEEMMREADPKDREALRRCMETMRNG